MTVQSRTIDSFQFPMNSSCTPYNQSDFRPEVRQLASDECDLLREQQQYQTDENGKRSSSRVDRRSTNPFSLAQSTISAKNRLRVAKCIVVGDISVGKTTLINRFVNDAYSDTYKATIGVDFEVQKFEILGRPFTLQIWDTAGQTRFRDITRIYYRGAHAVLICFDLGNFASFLNVKFWLNEVLEKSSTTTVNESNDTNESFGNDRNRPFIFMIGTKKDLVHGRGRDVEERVQREAEQLANEIGAELWMVSAAMNDDDDGGGGGGGSGGDNVNELFYRVACLTYDRYMAEIAEAARIEIEDAKNQLESVTFNKAKDKVKIGNDEHSKAKGKRGNVIHPIDSGNNGDDDDHDGKHNRTSSRKAQLIRMVNIPTEMISKLVSNITDQMQSMLRMGGKSGKMKDKLKKKKKRRKYGDERSDGTSTPDSGMVDTGDLAYSNHNIDDNGHGHLKTSLPNNNKSKKKKTFQCFNIRCTFTFEK